MPGEGRTFRRNTVEFWEIWPMPPKIDIPSDVVYVDGIYAPLVGRICMDQCMIKLPYMIENRTKVELFGKHISLQLMAKELDTITYEILCNLSSRLTRIYILDGKKCMECNSRLETINNGTF